MWGISLPALDAFIEQLPPGTDRDRLTQARAAAIAAFTAKEDDTFAWIVDWIYLAVVHWQIVPDARFKASLDVRLREQSADAANERRMRGKHPFDDTALVRWRGIAASVPGSKSRKARVIINRLGLPSHWHRTICDHI